MQMPRLVEKAIAGKTSGQSVESSVLQKYKRIELNKDTIKRGRERSEGKIWDLQTP